MALSFVIGWSVGGAVAVLVSALARPAVVISISVRTVSSGLTWSAAQSAVMGDNTGHSMETNTNNHQQAQQAQQEQHQVSLSRTWLVWGKSL